MHPVLAAICGFFLILWSIIYSIIAPLFPKKYRHKSVKNQIVLITGGGSGFGQLFAKKFAVDEGATVVIWDINKDGMEDTKKLVESGGGKCHAYFVDVSSKAEIYAAAKKVEMEVGNVDILINNAGIGEPDLIISASDESVEKIFKVNILSHFWTTKAFLPGMISKKRGHVVTISSVAGLFGTANLSAYSSTKFAAIGFHESLTLEIRDMYPDANISTTVICPYFVKTPMVADHLDNVVKSNVFLPIRETEPTVEEFMDAILSNKKFLVPVWGIRFLLFLKSNFPVDLILAIQPKAYRNTVKKLD